MWFLNNKLCIDRKILKSGTSINLPWLQRFKSELCNQTYPIAIAFHINKLWQLQSLFYKFRKNKLKNMNILYTQPNFINKTVNI
jgi:hypothetical protein